MKRLLMNIILLVGIMPSFVCAMEKEELEVQNHMQAHELLILEDASLEEPWLHDAKFSTFVTWVQKMFCGLVTTFGGLALLEMVWNTAQSISCLTVPSGHLVTMCLTMNEWEYPLPRAASWFFELLQGALAVIQKT